MRDKMIEFIIIAMIGIVLLSTKSFDFTSVILSTIYGLVIWRLKGVEWFLVLLAFLVTSLYATYYGYNRETKRHEHRGADNVLSNGFVAFMSAVFGYPYFYLGSISAALSDTMASEIGKLSKEPPVLITNPQQIVEAGSNGGVTKTGTVASIAGGLIIGALSLIFYTSFVSNPVPPHILFFGVVAGGVFGSVVDSLCGVLFENRKLMTNGSVNFTATLAGGIITTLIVTMIV